MAIPRGRLPSKHESVALFAACAFPVYSWSIFRYCWMVPAWEKYLGFWDIASVLAYALSLALAESLVGFCLLLLLHIILPFPFIRERFVSKGTTLVMVNALWALVLHRIMLSGYILTWTVARHALGATLYATSVAVIWILLHRWEVLAEYVDSFVDRLTVLLLIYVPLSAISILVVIARNIL